jgi:hypothetical protein
MLAKDKKRAKRKGLLPPSPPEPISGAIDPSRREKDAYYDDSDAVMQPRRPGRDSFSMKNNFRTISRDQDHGAAISHRWTDPLAAVPRSQPLGSARYRRAGEMRSLRFLSRRKTNRGGSKKKPGCKLLCFRVHSARTSSFLSLEELTIFPK